MDNYDDWAYLMSNYMDNTGAIGGIYSGLGFLAYAYDDLDETTVIWTGMDRLRRSPPEEGGCDYIDAQIFSSDEGGWPIVIKRNTPGVLTCHQVGQIVRNRGVVIAGRIC